MSFGYNTDDHPNFMREVHAMQRSEDIFSRKQLVYLR